MKDGSVMFESSYDTELVAQLKAKVPYQARKWDSEQKAWFITPEHVPIVVDICTRILGIRPEVPALKINKSETRLVFLQYLGGTKDRGGDEPIAYGFCDSDNGSGWNLIFPESVLRAWFCDDADPTEAITLYGILGVKRNASAEKIKKAYRQAARTHHPDADGDAEQFRAIQAAWEALKDAGKRARYDSGLAMAATLTAAERPAPKICWRPPVRCGRLLIEGRDVLGKFRVERILQWRDVRDRKNHTMISYWRRGDNHFTVRWA